MPRSDSGLSLSSEDSLKVGDISLEGNTILSKKEIEKLLPEKGRLFTQATFELTIDKILRFYSDRGFPFATIKPGRFSIDSIYVNLEFLIAPGDLERIEEVIIKGNSYTNSEFLRRKLPIKKGEVFNETELKDAVAELGKLEYIEIDSFQVIPGDRKGWVDVNVNVKEGDMGNIIGAVSYSRSGGLSGKISANNKNLFGKGRKINLDWMKEDNEFQEEQIEYTEPYILSLPMDLTFSLKHTYIKGSYNLTSLSPGIVYSHRDVSFFLLPGMEYFSRFQEESESYPFFETKFSYITDPFKFFYRERFRRGRGWDLETSGDFSFLLFNLEIEYFSLSLTNTELIFFKSFRGYPGMKIKKGARLGLELNFRFGKLSIYPLFDASWIKNNLLYSYGFGFNVGKVSFEYAIPWELSPMKGRVYITFNETP